MSLLNKNKSIFLSIVIACVGCGGPIVEPSSSVGVSSAPVSSSSASSVAQSQALLIEEDHSATCQLDATIESEHAGFTGIGYANGFNSQGSKMVWAVDADQAENVQLRIRFANGGTAARQGSLVVNDQVIGNVDFASATAWNQWQDVSRTISLQSGNNIIKLEATSGDGLANIDYIEIVGHGLGNGVCPALPSKITVWLAGDSTVANGLTPCPAGWGKYLQTYFNDQVTVRNSAAGGRSVRTWMYDVLSSMTGSGECALNVDGGGAPVLQSRWQEMLSSMKAGDYLLIQFGINDGDSRCPRHVGSQAFKESYAILAQEAVKRGVEPVFITPVSAIRCSGSVAVATRGFLQETFDVGNSNSVPVLDLHSKSIALYNSLGFCPAPNGDADAATTQPGAIGDFFCDDHTHFDNAGAQQIAKVVTEMIREKGLLLAQYLK